MSRTVVCAGGAVRDLTFRLHGDPVLGTSNPAALSSSSGGVARNVAENLAVLGCQVELVTAIGADGAGRTLVRELEAKDIGTQHVRAVAGHATAQYAAVIDPAGELTLGLAAMDVLTQIEPGWLDDAWPGPGGWLFCDTNLRPDVLTSAVSRARREGTELVIDAVSTPKVVRLPKDLNGVTLLNCNTDEARTWLRHNGFDDPGDAPELARTLLGAGAQAVLVTLGAGGVIAATGDEFHHVPAVPVSVVNVTGAGDALIAGAIAALVSGSTLAMAAAEGARRAAQVLAVPGSVLPANAAISPGGGRLGPAN